MGGLGTEPQEHGQQGPPARRTTHSLPFPFPGASFPLDSDLCPSQPPTHRALPVPQDPYVFLPEGTISLSNNSQSLGDLTCTPPAALVLSLFLCCYPELENSYPASAPEKTSPQRAEGNDLASSPGRLGGEVTEKAKQRPCRKNPPGGSQTPCASPCAASITRGVGAEAPGISRLQAKLRKGCGVGSGKAREATSKGIGREEVGREKSNCSPAGKDGNRGEGRGARVQEKPETGKQREQRGRKQTLDDSWRDSKERERCASRVPAPPPQGSGQKRGEGRRQVGDAAHLIDFRSSLDRGQVQGSREVQPLPLPLPHPRVSQGQCDPPRATSPASRQK